MIPNRDSAPGVTGGPPLEVSEVRFRFPPDQSGALVAYASCLVNDSILLNDIRIERGRLGGLVVVYPARRSATGRPHPTFHPVTREAGEAIRRAILGRLAALLAGQGNVLAGASPDGGDDDA